MYKTPISVMKCNFYPKIKMLLIMTHRDGRLGSIMKVFILLK